MLLSSINHVSVTVTNLPGAMAFFGPGGYYACYFRGPDGLKFESFHVPPAEKAARGLR